MIEISHRPPDRNLPWRARRIGKQYQNIGSDFVPDLKDVLRWKLGLGPVDSIPQVPLPPFVPDVVTPDLALIDLPEADAIMATWIGHSTYLLQMGGRSFLTDPQFNSTCSPVRLSRFGRCSPPGLSLAQLPPIDAVLLSHNHYDHMDRRSLVALGLNTPILCPAGVGKLLASWGFRVVSEMSWSESREFGGMQITCLPALHGSARTAFDRNHSLWCGWLVEHGGCKAIFLGDTGYAPFFKEIGDVFGPIDLALIPIGAYRPFWFMHPLHLQPEEAVRVHLDLRATKSAAMHWGTFALADDDLAEPPLLLEKALSEHGVSQTGFQVLRFGETIRA